MNSPYDLESKPLMYHAYLHGRADFRAKRPARERANMAPMAARAYAHGYHGDKWRRTPCGQLVWVRPGGRS
jgi:hypothetical protein